MKRNPLASALAAACMMAAGAVSAQVTIYKQPNFTGADRTFRDSVRDLAGSGFQNQASSAVVRSGRWELCSQPDFRGDCVVIGPGEHARLDAKVYHRFESLREVKQPIAEVRQPIAVGEAYGHNPPAGERLSALEIYTEPGFRGRPMRFNRDIADVERPRAEEGVSSLIVREGMWQVCSDANYRGMCRIFDAGRYPRVGRFDGTPIGSIRRVG